MKGCVLFFIRLFEDFHWGKRAPSTHTETGEGLSATNVFSVNLGTGGLCPEKPGRSWRVFRRIRPFTERGLSD